MACVAFEGGRTDLAPEAVASRLIGVVLHINTPSPRERMVWLPVLLVLAGCALVVARGLEKS